MTGNGPEPTVERVLRGRGSLPTGPWEVFGEHLVHHEIHYAGRRIELVRGPVATEGYAIRVFRPAGSGTGLGRSSSNDLSPAGLRRAWELAEETARHSVFPATAVELPGGNVSGPGRGPVDPKIRDRPAEALLDFGQWLLNEFPESPNVAPSFGSIRTTYATRSVGNSSGRRGSSVSTLVEFEWAVKATGGPEGTGPGEYWVNRESGRLDPDDLGVDPATWMTRAQDVRRAKPPESGVRRVLFPAEVLRDIVPAVLGYRLSGAAALRGIALAVGSVVASPAVTVVDDPTLPGAVATSACDDEGEAAFPREVVATGTVRGHLVDLVHAAALKVPPTGNGYRPRGTFPPWIRFTNAVAPGPSNLVIRPGDGGDDSELVEATGDGIWLDQLGYAFPDPLAGTYGGEIRIGYRIRGGKVAEPLRGGTVGGRVIAPDGAVSLLGGIRAVGKVPRRNGSFSSPTLLAEGISVAGSRGTGP